MTNRCEIVCLDTLGFVDQENDGPFTSEANENTNEADIVWKFDMMGEFNVSPHYMSTYSITSNGDLVLFRLHRGGRRSLECPRSNCPKSYLHEQTHGQDCLDQQHSRKKHLPCPMVFTGMLWWQPRVMSSGTTQTRQRFDITSVRIQSCSK